MKKLLFTPNSTAQAQSLLSAERQQYDKNLKEQTERWQHSLDMVVEGATEEMQEYKAETEELGAELLVAQQELWEWEDYYQGQNQAPDPFAETNELFASLNEQDASANKPLPPPAPLTPAVLQAPQLQAQHLPPQALPFTRQAREAQARASELEQELPAAEQEELQAEAASATQQWESHRDAELREALERIQLLEASQQARVEGTAPTLPTTRPYPIGQTTGLTIGQPVTALPAATNRGPWATTRDRYQQQAMPLPQTPLMTGVSTGVPSAVPPSGVASTHGAALPAMMVPNPSTPLGAFPGQPPLQNSPQLPADEYFKREKSPLPKLTIKGGDATSITRTVHEWLQKTAMAVNTWSTSAIQLWHHAVSVAKAAHQQWTMMVSCPEGFANWIAFHWQFFAPATVSPRGNHESRSCEHLPPGPCAVP